MSRSLVAAVVYFKSQSVGIFERSGRKRVAGFSQSVGLTWTSPEHLSANSSTLNGLSFANPAFF